MTLDFRLLNTIRNVESNGHEYIMQQMITSLWRPEWKLWFDCERHHVDSLVWTLGAQISAASEDCAPFRRQNFTEGHSLGKALGVYSPALLLICCLLPKYVYHVVIKFSVLSTMPTLKQMYIIHHDGLYPQQLLGKRNLSQPTMLLSKYSSQKWRSY